MSSSEDGDDVYRPARTVLYTGKLSKQLNSIFQEVQRNLPTIDDFESDDDGGDDNEPVEVFVRKGWTSKFITSIDDDDDFDDPPAAPEKKPLSSPAPAEPTAAHGSAASTKSASPLRGRKDNDSFVLEEIEFEEVDYVGLGLAPPPVTEAVGGETFHPSEASQAFRSYIPTSAPSIALPLGDRELDALLDSLAGGQGAKKGKPPVRDAAVAGKAPAVASPPQNVVDDGNGFHSDETSDGDVDLDASSVSDVDIVWPHADPGDVDEAVAHWDDEDILEHSQPQVSLQELSRALAAEKQKPPKPTKRQQRSPQPQPLPQPNKTPSLQGKFARLAGGPPVAPSVPEKDKENTVFLDLRPPSTTPGPSPVMGKAESREDEREESSASPSSDSEEDWREVRRQARGKASTASVARQKSAANPPHNPPPSSQPTAHDASARQNSARADREALRKRKEDVSAAMITAASAAGRRAVCEPEASFGPLPDRAVGDAVETKRQRCLALVSADFHGLAPADAARLAGWLFGGSGAPSTDAESDAEPFSIVSASLVGPWRPPGEDVDRQARLYAVLEPAKQRAVTFTQFLGRVRAFLEKNTLRGVMLWSEPSASESTPVRLFDIVHVHDSEGAAEAFLSAEPSLLWSPSSASGATSSSGDDVAVSVVHCARADVVASVIHRAFAEGLWIAGLRSVARPSAGLSRDAFDTRIRGGDGPDVAAGAAWDGSRSVVALCVCGRSALSRWQAAVGPADPAIARQTDPRSLRASLGSTRARNALTCTRGTDARRACEDVAYWFGGRLSSGDASVPAAAVVSAALDGDKGRLPVLVHPRRETCALLFAVAPSSSLAYTLATCLEYCESLSLSLVSVWRAVGLARTSKALAGSGLLALASVAAGLVPKSGSEPVAYVVAFSGDGAGVVGTACALHLREKCQALVAVGTRVDAAQLAALNACAPSVPSRYEVETSLMGLDSPLVRTSAESRQTMLMAFVGGEGLRASGPLLNAMVNGTRGAPVVNGAASVRVSPTVSGGDRETDEPFAIVGAKTLATLEEYYAKELTPLEIGEGGWRASVRALCGKSVLLVVVQRRAAFSAIARYGIGAPKDASNPVLVSPSPDVAFRQISLLFSESELSMAPPTQREQRFLPPFPASLGVLAAMTSGPSTITTVACVWGSRRVPMEQRLGRLLRRVARDGFSVAGLRIVDKRPNLCGIAKAPGDASVPHAVVCIRRENAVECLVAVLDDEAEGDASSGHGAVIDGLWGSRSYADALSDQSAAFPSGLCTSASECREDVLAVSSSRKLVRRLARGASAPPAMREIVVLAFSRQVIKARTDSSSPHPMSPLADAVDALGKAGFALVAGRLMWLRPDQEQAVRAAGYFPPDFMANVAGGPWAVFALERDDAVVRCREVIVSVSPCLALGSKLWSHVYVSHSAELASRDVCTFFDSLPGSTSFELA